MVSMKADGCKTAQITTTDDCKIVQIVRRIHAYSSFHVYLSDMLHFSFLMNVTSKRGPYSFM